MKKKTIIILISVLAVLIAAAAAAVVLLGGSDGGSGGGKSRAGRMWLVKAEGEVAVADDEGEDVPVRALPGMDLRLGLYSGYTVGTERESFGWLDLDDERFAKLDESSEAEVRKSGKKLEIVVAEGSLYFNVKKPLRDEETMEIRSSSMVMAIRGTSGWVTADGDTFDVYIIDGKVKCSVEGETESVTAGEWARMRLEGGEPTITVDTFDASTVPEFVTEEAKEDEDLREKLAALGVHIDPGPEDTGSDGPDGPTDGPEDTQPDDSGPEGPTGPDDNGPEGSETGGSERVRWSVRPVRPPLTHDLPDVYYQLPIFSGDAAGIQTVNDFFRQRKDGFLNEQSDLDARLNAQDGPDPDTYTDYVTTEVEQVAEGVVSVTQRRNQWNSNAHAPSAYAESWVFDVEAGKELTLRDVVDGTDEQILELLRAGFHEDTISGGYVDDGMVAELDLDELDFAVNGKSVKVTVSVVKIVPNAFGDMVVTASLPLSARYDGPGTPAGAGDSSSDEGWSISGGVLTVTPQIASSVGEDWSGAPWQERRGEIRSVVVEEGVTALGDYAFYNFYGLEEVSLPEGLVSIGAKAFESCGLLRAIRLPETLKAIGAGAFYDCEALETVTIPQNVTQVGNQAFYGCERLYTAIVLGPVEVLDSTFGDCGSLSVVELAEGVRVLDSAFTGCVSLREIDLPSTITEVGFSAFNGTSIVTLTVPEGVTEIGEHAFENCGKLESLRLPSTLLRIGLEAFENTPSLRTIEFASTRGQWEEVLSSSSGLSDAVSLRFGG